VPDFVHALDQADTLMYCPPTSWSDIKKDYSYMQCWTEFYLAYYSRFKTVLNIEQIWSKETSTMLALADNRKTDSIQIWNAGCSISHGVGIELYQRYGKLISNKLNLPISFLTHSGSSISWAADQILRSDIRANDLVIWGLTSHTRFPYYGEHKINHILSNTYTENPKFNKIIPIDQLDTPNMIYNAITKIFQVVQYCKKINAQLIIGGLLVDEEFIKFTNIIPNYITLCRKYGINGNDQFYDDLGLDNLHPGPVAHQYFADEILKLYNEFKI
jgi:hypothetical protein